MAGVGGLLGVSGGAGGISPSTASQSGDATSPFTGATAFNFGAGSGSQASGLGKVGGGSNNTPLILGGFAVAALLGVALILKK